MAHDAMTSLDQPRYLCRVAVLFYCLGMVFNTMSKCDEYSLTRTTLRYLPLAVFIQILVTGLNRWTNVVLRVLYLGRSGLH